MADDQTPFEPWNERGETPLAAFDGLEPEAPDWFKWAIGQAP